MNGCYESKLSQIAGSMPPSDLIKSAATVKGFRPLAKWGDLIGLIVTAAYLLQFLLPMNWFSLGRIMFIVRFGF